jgi:tRNA pseudouridine32 synthase/23S rRNA pseudouridine746 synthase
MWEQRVLFIDGEAIVIDKPAGLAVHPGSKTPDSLEDHLRHLRFGFRREPLPVHRLDRDTSGCLLLARNPKAHKRFQRAFEDRKAAKTYLAVLAGVPDAEEGTIDIPLGKVSTAEAGWRMVPDPDGKAAVSHWRRLAVQGGRALLLFSPETGRTHQLRVHAAAGLGIPIAGDPVYGDPSTRSGQAPSTGSGRGPPSTGSGQGMLLHARSLRLERDGKPPVEAVAPPPPSFAYAGFAGPYD